MCLLLYVPYPRRFGLAWLFYVEILGLKKDYKTINIVGYSSLLYLIYVLMDTKNYYSWYWILSTKKIGEKKNSANIVYNFIKRLKG